MSTTRAHTILSYLADLAPARKQSTDVIKRRSEFAWLGGNPLLMYSAENAGPRMASKTVELKRLAALDSLHADERLLRLGWCFIAGTIDVAGESTRFCLPLLSVPIRVNNLGLAYQISHEGTVEMPDDLFDWEARIALEESTDPYAGGATTDDDRLVERMPRMAQWVGNALARAGLPAAPLRGGAVNPLSIRDDEGLTVVAGAGIYPSRDVAAPDMAGVLRAWSFEDLAGSALSVLYGDTATPAQIQPEDGEILSPLPLNRAQHEALRRLRTETITVVSGPPGTGKSHLVAAAAIDQVARGRSVLIATQSDYAATVVTDLLERHPGPRFVRFGSKDARDNVAAELGDGLAIPLTSDRHRSLQEAAGAAQSRVRRIQRSIETLLQREADFAGGLRRREMSLLATAQTPGVLDEGFDLERAETLLARARKGIPVLRSWSRRWATARLRSTTRSDGVTTLDDIEAGLEAARAEQAVQRGLAGGGLSLVTAWDELETADTEYRDAVGRLVEATRRARENSKRKSARAVGTLASALRAGRARRRQMLREIAADDFLDVLPLWIGTLQEIDDTLPVAPRAFDLIIFDEASQIDQLRAAPALARARRAMIVGDPRQLRHVSFVSDESMADSSREHNLPVDLVRLLDVRRNSLFDVAASGNTITWLDEHFRSVPHIIGFSDRAFYGGKLRLMTQHPRNETRDAIETVNVAGGRDANGVNHEEVAEALRQIDRHAATGARSIGVVTPFRAQADAIEEAILARYGPEDIESLGLRAGTVHAFQGNERDVVIASLAIGEDVSTGSLNFLQDPNLFNVLVTRAKRQMVVITSVDPASLPEGLLTRYLRYAEFAPHASDGGPAVGAWAAELQDELQRYGVPVVASYPVAGWSVDLSVGERDEALGVETIVHPDGPAVHIEQHRALRRAGWDMADAFQSRWLTDAAGAAEMLSKQLLRRSPLS